MGYRATIHSILTNNNWVVYVMIHFTGAALGIINPLVSTHMEKANIGDVWIGANSTVFYLFLSLGSVFVFKRFYDKNLKTVIQTGLFIVAATALLFPMTSRLFDWFLIRALMGVGISFVLIGGQTTLHNYSDEKNRGVVSGLYSLSLALGFITGTIAGPLLYGICAGIAFATAAFYLLMALLSVCFFSADVQLFTEDKKTRIFRRITLSLHSIFAYGFAEATLITLYPVYLLRSHFTVEQMGYALGIFVTGSVIGTMPVMYLADRYGKVRLLCLGLLFGIMILFGIILTNNYSYTLFLSLLAGCSIGPIYPLSLAVTAQGLTGQELASATSLFTSSYSIGCTAGPLLSSAAMKAFGNQWLFSLSLLLFVTVFLRILLGMIREEQMICK